MMQKPLIIYLIAMLFAVIVLFPGVSAKEGSLKLLAVQHTGTNLSGSIADLYLEIKPGSGRVFVDTFPLTKLDTQVSTRLAKEIACDYIEANCEDYDFFYTIRAQSPIIAGPSAGAAITVLTISLIGDMEISDKVAVTGTINSGGIIGPVGGIKQKIKAAGSSGISKVLIPYGERYLTQEKISLEDLVANIEQGVDENTTAKDLIPRQFKLDLVEYGKSQGVEVKEVSDIQDVLEEYTGRRIKEKKENIEIDPDYSNIMEQLALKLCERSSELREIISSINKSGNRPSNSSYLIIYEEGLNLSGKGRQAMQNNKYYSAASYCFGSNVKLGNVVLILKNDSNQTILARIKDTEKDIKDYKKPEYRTISDLQAYMIVEERMSDALDFLSKSRQNLENGDKELALQNLAYAIERRFSAYSWSAFINGKGKEFQLTDKELAGSCQKKLSEAEERYQYVNLFLPGYMLHIREDIDQAYKEFNDKNYETCLFMSSKAKAEVDVILSVFGVEEEDLDELIDRKLKTVQDTIIRQTEEGIFPIVGYSYYEYASELKATDEFSSLLYIEYALEMSNLDIYFPDTKEIRFTDTDINEIGIFLIGLGTGMLIGVLVILNSKKRKKGKKNKPKETAQ